MPADTPTFATSTTANGKPQYNPDAHASGALPRTRRTRWRAILVVRSSSGYGAYRPQPPNFKTGDSDSHRSQGTTRWRFGLVCTTGRTRVPSATIAADTPTFATSTTANGKPQYNPDAQASGALPGPEPIRWRAILVVRSSSGYGAYRPQPPNFKTGDSDSHRSQGTARWRFGLVLAHGRSRVRSGTMPGDAQRVATSTTANGKPQYNPEAQASGALPAPEPIRWRAILVVRSSSEYGAYRPQPPNFITGDSDSHRSQGTTPWRFGLVSVACAE
jgi:hypothetical protein